MCYETSTDTTDTNTNPDDLFTATSVTVNGTTLNVGDTIRLTRRVYGLNPGSVVKIAFCDPNDSHMPVAVLDVDDDRMWLNLDQFEPAPGAELSNGEPENYKGLKVGDSVYLTVEKYGTPAGTKCEISDLDLDHEDEHLLVNLTADGVDQVWLEDSEYTTTAPSIEPVAIKQVGITLGTLVVPDASLTLAPLAEIMAHDPINPTLDGAQSVYLDGENTNVIMLAGVVKPLDPKDPSSGPIKVHSIYAVKDSMIMRFNMIDGLDTAASFGAERYAIAFSPVGNVVASTVGNTIEEVLRWVVDMKLTMNQKLVLTISGGFAG